MRRVSVIGWTVLALSLALAQQHAPASPQGSPVFRASADVATIDAVVTDADGRPVTDLTREDFEVMVAGKPQPLEQAVYVRTADQPRVLAAARAAASDPGQAAAPAIGSLASQALRATVRSPDDVARTIALVVDDLGLSFRSIYDVRRTVHKYIDTQIAPGDLVAIIRTAGGIGTLQQFTTDKRLLHRAADRLQWNLESRGGLEIAGPAEREHAPGGAAERATPNAADRLQEAMTSVGSLGALEFVARGLSALPGRKCIILFSSGFDQMFEDRFAGSERIWNAMRRLLARANAAGVVINTVDGRGLSAGALPGPRFANEGDWRTRDGFRDPNARVAEGTPTAGSGSGVLDAPGHRMGAADTNEGRAFISSQDSLRFIADQTGGLSIENTNDLNLGLSRILEDQQGYYLLGYTAPPGAPRGGWDQNRVQVRMKRRGLRVRARQGFFGPAEMGGDNAPAPTDPLLMAAVSPFASGAMTVRLTSLFGTDATTGSYVRSLLFIDPIDIRFDVDAAGRRTARLQILLLAVADNGQLAGNWKWDAPLALTDETYRRVTERGLVITVRSAVKAPGPYQLRAAVIDLAAKTIGSASQFLDVPEVGAGRLALSGLLMRGVSDGDQRPESAASTNAAGGLANAVLFEPEVRVLPPGASAVYAYEIYDGLKDDDQPFHTSVAVTREGKVVYQSPFTPLAAGPKRGDQMRAIPVGGQLTLGRDMAAGTYALEVLVRRQGKGKKRVERKQWLEFEIRP